MIIDAHSHLWKVQNGIVDGKPVYDIGGGKSNFGGVVRQMMPPYMTDGENNIERFIATICWNVSQKATHELKYVHYMRKLL